MRYIYSFIYCFNYSLILLLHFPPHIFNFASFSKNISIIFFTIRIFIIDTFVVVILTVGVIIIVFVWFPGIDALNATRSRTYQSCIRVCRAKFDPRRDGYQQFPEDYHHHDSNGFHQTSRMRTLAPDWIKLAKN